MTGHGIDFGGFLAVWCPSCNTLSMPPHTCDPMLTHPHKCRVYRNRCNGLWVVHCYFSDLPITHYRLWTMALLFAASHREHTTDTTGAVA